MQHIAILRQPFFDMVLSGTKTIESRWSMHKVAPYNKVKIGDEILLKETCKDVTATAKVKDVKYFELTPQIVEDIRIKYGKEIGARKKDISRIFNSETVLIGLFAGILSVTLSWVLTIPLSAIIKAIAGGTITTNMATLKFTHALILVGVSTVLTTIAGTVPARIASKKDPVICLRSE